MVVCKFFLSGNCRYGANCRFEHPQNTGGQNSNQNRFGALNDRANDDRKEQPWAINITDVKNDMTAGQGRPQWILSTYGPGRAPPASLLEDNEYSFEELRLRYYELASAGNEAQANQEAGALWSKAENGMQVIAQNADDVIKFMEDADRKHPNRYDFCRTDGTKTREELVKAAESSQNSLGGGFGQVPVASGFGQPAFGQPATSSGFGQSGFGEASQPVQSANPFAQPSAANAFGKPAFGQPAAGAGFGQSGFVQPSQPTKAGFGQPSQSSGFGAPGFGPPAQPAPAFGQPSQPTSGFGQPSQPVSGFGQPSRPAQSANPFAQPATGFGQTSQPASGFGQQSQPVSAFTQPSQPAQSANPFAQPSGANTFGKPTAAGGFGQTGFGQPSQPATSGFGQPSQPAQSTNQFAPPVSTGFGVQPQPATSGFGQPTQPAASGFGAGTGFGTLPSNASPFGQPVAAAATGGFGQPSNRPAITGFGGPSNPPASSSFGNVPTASTVVGSTPITQSPQISHPLTGHPSVTLHYTETIPKRAASFRPGTKEISSYSGYRVQYINDAPCYERPDGKGWERIWFPEAGHGPDVLALNAPDKKADLEGKPEDYTDTVKQAYVHLFTKGGFGEAGMPTVPPVREWCGFNF